MCLLPDTNIFPHIVAGAHDTEEVGNEEGAEHEEHGEESGVGLSGHWVRKRAARFSGDVRVKRSSRYRPKVRAVVRLALYVIQTCINLWEGGTVAKHRGEGVFRKYLSELLESRDDEKKRNQGVEDVLGETSEIADKSGSLEKGNQKRDDESPDSDPEPPGEELARQSALREVKESLVVEKDRPSDSGDDERATGEECENESTKGAENDRL